MPTNTPTNTPTNPNTADLFFDSIDAFVKTLNKGTESVLKLIDDFFEELKKSFSKELKTKRKSIIDDVENGKTKLDEDALGNKRKKGDQTRTSNYAEMKVDEFFETKTFKIGKNEGTLKRVSTRTVNTLDDKIGKGIDGIYEFSSPPPHYIITEVKYNTAKLSKEITKSNGSQMSKNWIRYDLRKGAVSPAIADDILIKGYEPLLCKVSTTGEVTVKTINQTLTSATEGSSWLGQILK